MASLAFPTAHARAMGRAMDALAPYAPLLALPLAGMVAGFLAGLLGIGGGFLMVPVMAWAFTALDPDLAGRAIHVAIGTSLATIVPTAVSSALAHRRRGALDVPTLRGWAPLIALGALGGGFLARGIEADALRAIFGGFVIVLALHFAMPSGLPVLRAPPSGPVASRVIAALIGLVSALMGIGGAVLSVPALRAAGLTMHRAVGTGAAIGFAIALPGVLGYVLAGWGEPGRPPGSIGFVNPLAWVLLVPFTVAAAPLGARVAHRTDANRLRLAFAVFLGLVGLRMVLG